MSANLLGYCKLDGEKLRIRVLREALLAELRGGDEYLDFHINLFPLRMVVNGDRLVAGVVRLPVDNDNDDIRKEK